MSSTLNDTIEAAKHLLASANDEAAHAVGSAKHAVGSAKGGAEQAAASARTTWFDGVKAVTGMVAMLRGLQTDDALGWVGLSRRRSPVAGVGIFSAGVVVGAGAALLFAPMSGAETRRRFMGAFSALKGDAKSTLDHAGAEVKADVAAAGKKIEDLVSHAKEVVVDVEHKVEGGAIALKDLAASKVDGAAQAVKGAATAATHDANKPALVENGNGKGKVTHPS